MAHGNIYGYRRNSPPFFWRSDQSSSLRVYVEYFALAELVMAVPPNKIDKVTPALFCKAFLLVNALCEILLSIGSCACKRVETALERDWDWNWNASTVPAVDISDSVAAMERRLSLVDNMILSVLVWSFAVSRWCEQLFLRHGCVLRRRHKHVFCGRGT